jgi:hypothetical protein
MGHVQGRGLAMSELDADGVDELGAYWEARLREIRCDYCNEYFLPTGKRGRVPRFCSEAHKKRAQRKPDREPAGEWAGPSLSVPPLAPTDHDGPGGRYRKPAKRPEVDVAVLDFLIGFTSVERLQGRAPLATGRTPTRMVRVIGQVDRPAGWDS